MEAKRQIWHVRDKRRLLIAVMEELAGSAHISFEGDLTQLSLASLAGASELETPALQRNTLSPRQDFVVLPLAVAGIHSIIAAIGGTVSRSIIHVQIEKNNVLELGFYDHFHPDAMFFGQAFTPSLLERFESDGMLRKSRGH